MQGRLIGGDGKATLDVYTGFSELSLQFLWRAAAQFRQRSLGLEPEGLGQWDLKPVIQPPSAVGSPFVK